MKRIVKDINDSGKIFKDMGMNKWRPTSMPLLKTGDRFRLYSRVGQPLGFGGEETMIAKSDAYQVNGAWAVEVKHTAI